MNKDSKVAAKPTQKENVSPPRKRSDRTHDYRMRHYDEEPEASSPARGSISRDPQTE